MLEKAFQKLVVLVAVQDPSHRLLRMEEIVILVEKVTATRSSTKNN